MAKQETAEDTVTEEHPRAAARHGISEFVSDMEASSGEVHMVSHIRKNEHIIKDI